MKLTNLIIAVVLAALCALGWASLASSRSAQNTEYEAYIQQAEDCIHRGLYQRAIENYQNALAGSSDADIYLHIADAYSSRYAEAPKDTFDDYLRFVKRALNAFPGDRALLEHLVKLCTDPQQEPDYKTLYAYLKKAVSAGCDDEQLLTLYARARYDYSLRSNTFLAITDSGSEVYPTLSQRGWNLYSQNGGYQLTDNWAYVGPLSGDGVTVICGEDSRIFNVSDATVRGIFQGHVTAAGIYAEGLIPAQVNGKYGYYNDYADLQFGSYDYAGTFQNGLAAVENGGAWMFVDTEGAVNRDGFERIVTDCAGRYLVNDLILVKEAGRYTVYDPKWKQQAELTCDEVGVLSPDGIIAFRAGSKWGYMDMTGNVVISPQYSSARSFSNGLAAVKNDGGLWGFIDRSGRLVIDYAFTDAGYMSAAGICPVRTDVPAAGPASGSAPGGEAEAWAEWNFLSLTNGITDEQP